MQPVRVVRPLRHLMTRARDKVGRTTNNPRTIIFLFKEIQASNVIGDPILYSFENLGWPF
jgi:hypothetical protein